MKKQKPDIAELITQMQQQLASLEKKVDTLISQFSVRAYQEKPEPKPFQRPQQPQNHGQVKHDTARMERPMYKAVCADCHKECEVPFRPSQDRPVYCKECYSKRRTGGAFKPSHDNKPKEKNMIAAQPISVPTAAETRKPAKKKPAAKKRTKAAKR